MDFRHYWIGLFLTAMATGSFAANADQARVAEPLTFGRILFLGNSITWHGPKKDIGWTGNWGMAASAEGKDFAHIVAKGLSKPEGEAPVILIRNISNFERDPGGYDADARLADGLGFNPDLIILAVGENVQDLKSAESKTGFRDGLRKLLKRLMGDRRPRLVVRSCFWPNGAKDQILKQVCDEVGGTFVDIGHLSKDEANFARSERQFDHKGVAAHPGDRGMQAIAEAILEALARPR